MPGLKKTNFIGIIFLLTFLTHSTYAMDDTWDFPPNAQTSGEARKARYAETLPHAPDIVFPYYYLKGLTYPINQLATWIDHYGYAAKAMDGMKDKSSNFTVYPILTMGDGSRFGWGLGSNNTNLLQNHYVFTGRAVMYTDFDVRAQVAFGKRDAFLWKGKKVSFVTASDLFMDSDESYYGIGANTSKSVSGNFSDITFRTGGAIGIEVLPHFTIAPHLIFDGGHAGYRNLNTGPSVQQVFPSSELAGFGQNINYIDLGLRLFYDTRDDIYYAEHGGLQSVTFHYMQGLNVTGFNFFKLNLDFERHFKLPPPRLVIWLHNGWTFEDSFSGSQIPFYRLATADVFSPLRGFNRGRFRDKSSVVFNAELRYPLWQKIDGNVFLDTGRVFHGIENFSFKDFRYSVGGGLRVTVHNFYVFKTEIAYGGEGVNVVFKAIQEL